MEERVGKHAEDDNHRVKAPTADVGCLELSMHRALRAMGMAMSGPLIFDFDIQCIQYCGDFGLPYSAVPLRTTVGS